MDYKIYIQAVNGFPISDWCCSAFLGFRERGANIVLFESIDEVPVSPYNVVVGFVEDTLKYFDRLGVPKMDALNIPASISNFSGRSFWYMTVGMLKEVVDTEYPMFVKPITTKGFVAGVLKKREDISFYLTDIDDDTKIMVSDVVDFVSEYRCYVIKGELKGIKHYLGEFRIFPNVKVIEDCIAAYKDAPAGYTIDFGVTSDGRTILVECNDGWSIGNYGLEDRQYVNLLNARWLEIMKTIKK